MRKQRHRTATAPTTKLASEHKQNAATIFKFGEPEQVLSNSLADYLGVFAGAGNYYEPPISLKGLATILGANGHHGTIPPFRRDRLIQHYKTSDVISDWDLGCANIDHDVFGNCYLQRIENVFGETIQFKHLPAISMRRMTKADTYCQLQKNGKEPIEFKPGEVVHLKEYDVRQSIYGIPQYFGGINSVMLSEDATLFRRKYYVNGAHMGYILYTSDSSLDPKDEDAIKKAVKESKGVGNFRSLYLNIPNGKKDSVQLIPVGDIATKDEFERIKNTTRADVLAMWRMQPALCGAIPENVGGFGDIWKIAEVYFEYETVPMQDRFLQLNQFLKPARRIEFGKPESRAA
ncbi:phage portal protein [Cellvibrio sp. UBA7671]|uniref:phage portal protein n=1 Tax=Cellvibrio sp. UBA7671 TaxID=1946312 RepID=UPI002F350620